MTQSLLLKSSLPVCNPGRKEEMDGIWSGGGRKGENTDRNLGTQAILFFIFNGDN
jgi:hypothetical protein